MDRRRFLVAVPLAVAGCSEARSPQPHDPSIEARKAHLEMLQGCRVPATAVRTTPKAAVDVVARFPDLRPLVKVAVRLHPRYDDEPAPDASKLGGRLLWPPGEPWPTCPEFRVPMQAVLQLRIEDAPPRFPFRPKTDLFQLFWSPRATKAGPPHLAGVCRSRAGVRDDALPPPEGADLGFVPVPCRLFPERVIELPPVELMPTDMRRQIEGWKPASEFDALFAAAPGTKAGGWPRVALPAACPTCVFPMDYLLTIASSEWTAATAARWKPTEDSDADGHRRAFGFDFGRPDAAFQVYVCRRCERWPLRAVSA